MESATIQEIASFLGVEGQQSSSIVVSGVSTLENSLPRTIAFVKHWDAQSASVVLRNPETVYLVPKQAEHRPNLLAVENPRLAFAYVVRNFFDIARSPGISPAAVVAHEANISPTAYIGHGAIIGGGVFIGDRTEICEYVVVRDNVRIGSDCRVGSHTVIGDPGFGYERDEDGIPVHIPHLGSVTIGDNVEIGNNVSIARGTIENTVIHDDVKVDDAVFVAHNVVIGAGSMIIAGAEISGGVRIGKRVWVAPEVSVRNQVTIGDDAVLGMGAVVVKDVRAGAVVAGVPATEFGN